MSTTLVVTLTVDQLTSIVEDAVQRKLIQLLPPPPVKLLNAKEAAAFLRISDPTLRSYRDQGLIKEHLIGNIRRYRQDELEEAAISIKKYKAVQRA